MADATNKRATAPTIPLDFDHRLATFLNCIHPPQE